MAEADGELDLPVPVPRAKRSRPERSSDKSLPPNVPPSAQWAALLLQLPSVAAGFGGWFLAGALGAVPAAGAIAAVGALALIMHLVVVPALVWRNTRPCPGQVRDSVLAVAAGMGVTVFDVQMLGSRSGRVRSVAVHR